jgi:HlyD family secretion protein
MLKKIIPVTLIIAAASYAFTSWRAGHTEFRYAGTVEATKVDIPARLPTVITEMPLTEGQPVSKAQILASLACDELKIDHELLGSKYQRAVKLHQIGSMPPEAYDDIKARWQAVDLKLGWCQISSPIDGTILTRYREPGEWVSPGTKLYTVADLNKVWAYIYVPEAQMAKLKPGMTVQGYVPDLGQRKITGVIAKINEEAEFTPKNVQTQKERTLLIYGIKIQFENRGSLLKIGMPVEIDLPEE